MSDLIKEFIEELPAETLHQAYIKNAARHADNAVTAQNVECRKSHKYMAREYTKLAMSAAKKP